MYLIIHVSQVKRSYNFYVECVTGKVRSSNKYMSILTVSEYTLLSPLNTYVGVRYTHYTLYY